MRRAVPLVLAVTCVFFAFFTGCGGGSSSGTGSTLPNPVPAIAGVSPASVSAGAPSQTVTISGTGFVTGSVVSFSGTALQTTYVSPTSLQVSLASALLANGAADAFSVSNPTPGGGSSPQVEFDVMSPTPVVSSITPSTLAIGNPAVITVTGTGFEANSTGLWNGSPRPTTVISSTSVQITLTAADVQSFGTGQITVSNPGPGGSTAPAVTLVVLAPLTVTAVTPSSVQAGSPAQNLAVTGTGFVTGSVVSMDGTALPTTVAGATSLAAAVPASLLANGRTASVTVTNPATAVNAGTSSPIAFSVNSPTPVLTGLAPANVMTGQAATITLTGSGFEANSSVLWNGAARPTTLTGATSLQVSLSAVDLQTAGTGQIAVNNPGPGGTTTAAVALNIYAPLAVTSLSPTTVTAGSGALTLAVNGAGFVAGSVVSLDGNALQTTYASSTSLQAAIPATALANGRTGAVTVANPSSALNAGISAAVNLPITSATPTVSALTPANTLQGQPATVTLTGTGFESNSSVLWNGSARPTTFLTATSLQVALTAADLGSTGAGQITVNNPGPSGGVSAPASLTVYALPVITAVSPNSVVAGSPAQTLTVSGTGFNAGSVVSLDGVALQTTYASATSLGATIPASALASGRTASVTVINPNPNGGTSAAVSFSVGSPAPTITSLTPGVAVAGISTSVTVTGTGFEADSGILWNGSARTTTFISSTSLKVVLSAADLQTAGSGQITVNNPGPGGSTTAPFNLTVIAPPVIASLTPATLVVNPTATGPSSVTMNGTNFASNATVQGNGQTFAVTSQNGTQIVIQVPAGELYNSGTFSLTVTNPAANGGVPAITSQAISLPVINPTATFSVYPNSAASGSPDLTVTVNGQGFFPDTAVQWNRTSLQTTYTSNYSLTAVIPAALLANLGTANISILTPENQGQAPPTQPFSTYLPLPVNDIAWNATDGYLYATIAGSGGPGLGNSLVAIDPATGVIKKTIFVGSEPNRLALSDDGTQAFVGLNDVGAVRQVNLTTGVAGIQFALGGGPGVYNPPFTAESLAVLPGQPNSVAVYASSGVVTIYDAGVARAKTSSGLETYFTSNYGGLAFGASSSILYVSSEAIGSYVYALTVDSTGITASKQLSTSGSGATLQYDNGRLYFPNATVSDATTGATLGQFSTTTTYSTVPSPASGPVWSDSTLNTAWVLPYNYSGTGSEIIAYSESTFNPITTLPITGITDVGVGNPADLVRWGQTGLAFHTSNQLYIVQGPIVKDVSSSPADLQVTVQAPATSTTGTPLSYQFQVKNAGPNSAQGVTLTAGLAASITSATVSTSQGTCSGSGQFYCDLGTLANGATTTVTLTGTPTLAGSVESTAIVNALSYDPSAANNQVTANTIVTGPLFSAVPVVTGVTPNMVAAGGTTFTLTVNGSGFSTASSILWNGTALPTSFVSAAQVTATVDSSLITALGWAEVSVSSVAPGGGQSGARTVSIYSLLNVPANAMVYDPFTRKLYAVLPSTSTTITGNSLVTIDPNTGNVGQPVNVGSEPNLLAETTSGNYLYIGLSGAKSLGKFDLVAQALVDTVPLTSPGYFGGPAAATGLATLPGLDNSVSAAGIGILDFTGATAAVRPNSDVGFNDAIFPDASHVYTYDNESTGAEFYRYTVDANGIHLVDGTTLLGTGGFSGLLALDAGIVYSSGGGIINPSTTPPSMFGVLPLGVGPYGSSLVGAGVVPYATEGKSFNIGVNDAGTALTFVERFDTQHFALEDEVQFPSSELGSAVNGTRWGQDGLAYILAPGYTGSTPAQVLIMRGPFILPAEATANPAPTLSAVGNGTLAVGSGNQYVTVTGTGFMPGASVIANGVGHNTTFIDAGHLSVAVAASELLTAGSVPVTCTNPGSGASNSVTLTVQ